MRRPATLLLVLGLLGGAAYLWGGPAAAQLGLPFLNGGEGAGAQPRLRLAAVDRGPITAVVSATGTVNPTVSVIVSSQLSGQIREVLGDHNMRVAQGQPLARLDMQQLEATRAAALADSQSAAAAVLVARAQAERAAADATQAVAQVAAARSAVAQADAQLRDAEFEARRTEELRRSGVGATRDATRAGFTADGARANLAQAVAQVAQAEAQLLAARATARTALAQVEAAEGTAAQKVAQLRQVEVNLSFATIRSPIAGVVVSRAADVGMTVAASLSSPTLFTIAADLDEMEVWATVDESDIGRVRPGQPALFTVAAHPSVTLRGTVREIRLSPTTVNNVVTYTVVVSARNDGGRMLPGMTATLRVVADERGPETLRVPNAALRWRPAGQGNAASAPQSPMEQAIAEMEDLTPAQRAEIDGASREFRERLAALPAEGNERRQGVTAARQRLASRVSAILTPDQRARLAAARGGSRPQEGQAGTVHVLDSGVPRAVPVRTGLTDGSVTEVLSGALEAGMEVVVGAERAAGAAPRPSAPARPLF